MILVLQKVSHWYMANGIHLNPTKSDYLIILPKSRETPPQRNLYLNNIPLSTSKSVKYLGVNLNFQLNFQVHIAATKHTVYLKQLE